MSRFLRSMDIYNLINSSSAKLHVVVLSAFKVVKRDKRMKNDKLLTNMIEELHQYSETQYSETQLLKLLLKTQPLKLEP